MRTEVIHAENVDEAAKKLLRELAVTGSSKRRTNNVIYFDGWDGLGASAVLREVSRRLTVAGPEFLRVLHVDCSKWESRRALQRDLAGQLELPAPVMELFNVHDEDDDYRGVAEGRRAEIPEVGEVMAQHVHKQDKTFVVIFHNGSDEEVNLNGLGFPMSVPFSRHKMLWSFQGRFRLYPRSKINVALTNTTSTTDLLLSVETFSAYKYKEIMRCEAEELINDIDNLGELIGPAATVAANCFLYITKLRRTGSHLTAFDLTTHGFNYCICDGVIQLQQHGDVDNDGGAAADKLWLWSHALQDEMRLDIDYYQNPHSPVPVKGFLHDNMAFWASPTYGVMLIPGSQRKHIPQGTFLQFDRLCVLKLYDCVFNFKSPPFLCCHNLRFLWIDHCRGAKDEEAATEEDLRRCFQRLWVLHVRATFAFLSAKMMDFITQVRELIVLGRTQPLGLFRAHLSNIRKIQVENSSEMIDSLPLRMDKLELLQFSGFLPHMKRLHVPCGYHFLVTIIIQSNGRYVHLQYISLKGCMSLKNLFLSGSFPYLRNLDISGTAVKKLNLSEVAMLELCNLFMFGCWNLCAILWPSSPGNWKNLGNLGIDTTQRDRHDVGPSPSPPTKFGWYIAARDTKLLWSLEPFKDQVNHMNVHLDISTISSLSDPRPSVDVEGRKVGSNIVSNMQQQFQSNNNNNKIYADFVGSLTFMDGMQQQANKCNNEPPDVMCICPPSPSLPPSQGCYMHIEDQMGMKSSHSTNINLLGFICDSSKILHIHDSLFITSILASSSAPTTWRQLEWCRVERCPKLECVFDNAEPEDGLIFNKLRTIWASHLPHAYYILKFNEEWGYNMSLMNLTLLHLDRCPRLAYAFFLAAAVSSLHSLETLEITFCNDLFVVFYGRPNFLDTKPWSLPQLKCIHLHELPKLQLICGKEWDNLHAPKLETVKIRGCWSLTRLPCASGKNTVECDCEKEWWDALKWDSKAHSESYKPTHPRHYKKKMLRGSVLR